MKKYITTPIYYVNDKPHLGHAYTTLACDTWARFQKIMGHDVFFLTGTDEHGQKIQQAAEKAGIAPQSFVDKVSLSFKDLLTHLETIHDDFIRTTEDRHKKAAQALWEKMEKNGHIYLGKYEGWYSVRDEAFYQDNELINGKAPTGADVEWTVEESYFFKLSAFEDKLLKYYEDNPNFIMPSSRRNEVLSFVKSGLRDLSISRTSFNWGIPVPNAKDLKNEHIMYVWVDALTNYLTAIGYPDHFDDVRFSNAIHVVGKDILRFHAIYWPAFLMAADIPLPKQIIAHGWWTVEGEKMSKSIGNTIDPLLLIDDYGCDAVRNYIFREMPFGQDGNFSKHSFLTRTNADLANAYGNLVQRVLSFIQKNADAKVPEIGILNDIDKALIQKIDEIENTLIMYMDTFQFNKYCDEIWKVIFDCNAYVDAQQPWALKKTDTKRMETVLYTLCETIRKIALFTQPILPLGSAKILDYLSISKDRRTVGNLKIALLPGMILPEPSGLYPRFKID